MPETWKSSLWGYLLHAIWIAVTPYVHGVGQSKNVGFWYFCLYRTFFFAVRGIYVSRAHLHRFMILNFTYYLLSLQDEYFKFNRAALLNIGFLESIKSDNFTCFIFHDVDMLPENTQNIYTCTQYPRHMTVGISTNNYRWVTCVWWSLKKNNYPETKVRL